MIPRPSLMVPTVLGLVPGDDLGATNYHEHVFQTTPLLPGDELDDVAASRAEIASLVASGFNAMIDATPIGLGRRNLELPAISRSTGCQIVVTTGFHRDAHYADQPGWLEMDTERCAEIFTREIVHGVAVEDRDYLTVRELDEVAVAQGPCGPVRAGIGKVGIEYWRISPVERRTIEALGQAHRRTGVPIMVHTEFCTAADEVLDLFEELGVSAAHVVLAHADRNPDAGLLGSLAGRGAHLGFDGAARPKSHPDSVLIECTRQLVEAGHGDRILLGGDVARASRYQAYGNGMPGLAYLGRRYVPRLRQAVGDAAVDLILRVNPGRLLAWAKSEK